jgi:GxxExxY protein
MDAENAIPDHYKPLSEREETIGRLIVDAAFAVHRELGPGLLEKIYEICFCYELELRGLSYRRQVDLPINYKGKVFDEGLRADVFVEDLVVCEIKAVDQVNPVWRAQIISHLKMMKRRLGYLINFNAPLIKQGLSRIIV